MRAASNPVRLGKYSLGKIFFTICKYVLLIFAAFCALVPLVSCVITAFKTVEVLVSSIGGNGYVLLLRYVLLRLKVYLVTPLQHLSILYTPLSSKAVMRTIIPRPFYINS